MDGTSVWKVEGKQPLWVARYSECLGSFSEVRVRRCALWKTYDDKMWSKIRKVLIRGNRAASPEAEHVDQEAVPASGSVKEDSLTSGSVTDVSFARYRYPLAQMIQAGQ